jgi:IS5 family transposase
MVKASLAREEAGPHPTDRGKKGSKRHLLVDGAGIPLSLELTGANVHDVKRIQEVLDGVVAARPEWTGIPKEHLCADKGYYGDIYRT